MSLLKNGFLEKIETWHVGFSCQYTHFMSFSSKSEHDTIADQATLMAWSDTAFIKASYPAWHESVLKLCPPLQGPRPSLEQLSPRPRPSPHQHLSLES